MSSTAIGSVLRSKRNEAGLSVEQVSDALIGLGFKASQKTIYSWESGNSQPTPDALLAMCDIYKINDVLGAFGYINIAPAEQEPNEEQTLISYYRKASKEDRSALLRFAYYAAHAAIEPSREELEAEALRARDYLIEQSHSQSDSLEAAK